jgi:hypothetical protein
LDPSSPVPSIPTPIPTITENLNFVFFYPDAISAFVAVRDIINLSPAWLRNRQHRRLSQAEHLIQVSLSRIFHRPPALPSVSDEGLERGAFCFSPPT